jgi:hypothetical protein
MSDTFDLSTDEPYYVEGPNPIDQIAEELTADRIHLDSLRLDRRMNAKDYEFITRLPLSAKQLINILYELYPPTLLAGTLLAGPQQQREQQRQECDPELVDLTESID